MLTLWLSWMSVQADVTNSEAAGPIIADLQAAAPGTLPVYRLWSPSRQCHLYTLDEAEKTKLSKQSKLWTYEGIAFQAFAFPAADGALPVYRFWSKKLRSYFYTLDTVERDLLRSQYRNLWKEEGIAFYAYAAAGNPVGTLPVHRFWSTGLSAHFYTMSDTERFLLLSGYPEVWDYEMVAWYAYPPPTAAVPAFAKGPYVEQVTSTSARILWQTTVASGSEVRYGVGTPEQSAVCDPAFTTLHEVALTGLVPGIVYTYQAISGSLSRTATFRTAPSAEQTLRFVVYGDSRSDVETHRQTIAGIIRSKPDVVFHTGDLVTSGRDYGNWDTEFFGPADELLGSIPLVPVLGNHEYAGTGPLWFFYFFDRPLNEGWFAATYGNTRFIGLDTNVGYTAGSPQYQWLVQELQSNSYRAATWHVMIFHSPPFTQAAGRSDDVVVQSQLIPLFEQYGVDAVFCGHTHAYERYLYHGIQYIVTGGGGAPLYEVPAATSLVRQFGVSTHHYCVVNVDPRAGTLSIAAVDLDGQTLDAVTLSQPR